MAIMVLLGVAVVVAPEAQMAPVAQALQGKETPAETAVQMVTLLREGVVVLAAAEVLVITMAYTSMLGMAAQGHQALSRALLSLMRVAVAGVMVTATTMAVRVAAAGVATVVHPLGTGVMALRVPLTPAVEVAAEGVWTALTRAPEAQAS
jgi:hypothetical protein